MSLSNTSFNTKRGPKGEIEPTIAPGGFVTYTVTASGVLDSIAKGSNASHVALTSSSGAFVVSLISTDVARGTIKKIGFSTSGTSIGLASKAAAVISNGTSAVPLDFSVLAANSGASVVLQYQGGKSWKLIEINGIVSTANSTLPFA